MLKFVLDVLRHLGDPNRPIAAVATPTGQAVTINWPLILARLGSSVWLAPLVALLDKIQAADTDYDVRNPLVVQAVSLAQRMGMVAGFRMDPGAPEWPVAYIELPTGQVSWHLPQHPVPFDGHTTAEKYARCQQLAEFALLHPAARLTTPVATAPATTNQA